MVFPDVVSPVAAVVPVEADPTEASAPSVPALPADEPDADDDADVEVVTCAADVPPHPARPDTAIIAEQIIAVHFLKFLIRYPPFPLPSGETSLCTDILTN